MIAHRAGSVDVPAPGRPATTIKTRSGTEITVGPGEAIGEDSDRHHDGKVA